MFPVSSIFWFGFQAGRQSVLANFFFQDIDNCGPDLLALHSCVICHDIFTTEADLLDHTIAFHASANITEAELDSIAAFPEPPPETPQVVPLATNG